MQVNYYNYNTEDTWVGILQDTVSESSTHISIQKYNGDEVSSSLSIYMSENDIQNFINKLQDSLTLRKRNKSNKHLLKVRQSYHGTGGKEGYKWKVYDAKDKKIGELERFPINSDSIIKIGDGLYVINKEYPSDNPRHEKTEVYYFELVEYEPQLQIFDAGDVF